MQCIAVDLSLLLVASAPRKSSSNQALGAPVARAESLLRPRTRAAASMARNPWAGRARAGGVEGLLERHPEAFNSLRRSDVAAAELRRNAASLEEVETIELIETTDRLAEQSLEVREAASPLPRPSPSDRGPGGSHAANSADGWRNSRPAGPGPVEKSGRARAPRFVPHRGRHSAAEPRAPAALRLTSPCFTSFCCSGGEGQPGPGLRRAFGRGPAGTRGPGSAPATLRRRVPSRRGRPADVRRAATGPKLLPA